MVIVSKQLSIIVGTLKKKNWVTLASGLVGWNICLVHQKVADSIPGQGTYPSCGFDPQSGHIPRLWVQSPVRVCMGETTNGYFSFTSIFPPLPLSLPFSLKSINIPSDEGLKKGKAEQGAMRMGCYKLS